MSFLQDSYRRLRDVFSDAPVNAVLEDSLSQSSFPVRAGWARIYPVYNYALTFIDDSHLKGVCGYRLKICYSNGSIKQHDISAEVREKILNLARADCDNGGGVELDELNKMIGTSNG